MGELMLPQGGGINLELTFVAMASAVENPFARMVEWDIGCMGRQW